MKLSEQFRAILITLLRISECVDVSRLLLTVLYNFGSQLTDPKSWKYHWDTFFNFDNFEMLNSLPGVTILLSLTVFLNMVSATMPVTSDNPLLGKVSCFLTRRKGKQRSNCNHLKEQLFTI
jgi:hypothetical protein